MSDTNLQPLRIGIFSQARMSSSRLPAKILKEIGGKALLEFHIERLKQTGLETIIVTTLNDKDDSVQSFCEHHAIRFFRGSEENVLERFYEANNIFNFDVIIRVTSDCPLIDASLIIEGVNLYKEMNDDHAYVSNSMPRTHARGFDFEIFSAQVLKETFLATKDPYDLEHVTPYMRENKGGNIKFGNIAQEVDHGDWRICVDTDDDFRLVQKLVVEYQCDKYDYQDIEKVLVNNPELLQINQHVIQKGK
jgi:spore coat polysaccharide biosynthesis protein SpsF